MVAVMYIFNLVRLSRCWYYSSLILLIFLNLYEEERICFAEIK